MTLYVKAGDVIFNEGDKTPSMFVIEEGKVAIVINAGQDSEKQLVELEAGQFFGEMSLLENLPRSATAIAVTDGALDVIDADSFNGYVESNPDFARKVMQYFSSRLRAVTMDYQEACRTIAKVYALDAVKEAVEKEDLANPEPENAEVEPQNDDGEPKKKKGFLLRSLEKFADAYNSDVYRQMMFGRSYYHF